MTSMPGIGELYLAARRSFADLASTLTADDWATPVPCCPGWSVHDVLSHVAGIPDDMVNGRIDGVATPPWTAAQVARGRRLEPSALLERWSDQAAAFAAAIDSIGEVRPPVDCHSHEHDVRHALARPGERASQIVRVAATWLRWDDDVTPSPPLDDFELFRSRLGRRSREQVLGYAWTVPPDDDCLRRWFVFGPADHAVEE